MARLPASAPRVRPAVRSRLTPAEVDRLLEDSGFIRNRRKLEATIDNAVEVLALEKDYGSLKRCLRPRGGFEGTVTDLRRRARFLGDLGDYYFLYVVGEKVPSHEEWKASRARVS